MRSMTIFKKIIFTLLVSSIFSMGQFLFAQTNKGTVLKLNHTEVKEVLQDEIQANLRYEVEGKSRSSIQDLLNTKIKEAKERHANYKEVQFRTGHYSVYRHHEDRHLWIATQYIHLSDSNDKRIRKFVKELQDNNFLVTDLRYSLSEDKAQTYTDILTTAAIENLGKRAEKIAKDLNKETVRFTELIVHDRPVSHQRFLQQAKSDVEENELPVVEPGYERVQLRVEGQFELL